MDSVEWLRGHSPTLRIAMRLDEAADEIERLREALIEVSGYVARAEWFYMTEETKAVVDQVFEEVK